VISTVVWSAVCRTALRTTFLDRAPQHLARALDGAFATLIESHRAVAVARFVIGIGRNLGDHLAEVEHALSLEIQAAFDARHRQQLTDQSIETLGLPFDAIEMHRRRRIALAPREPERHVQSRQWRPEGMRDVGEQPSLCGDQRFNPLRHLVEIPPEIGELVAAIQHAAVYACFKLLSAICPAAARRRSMGLAMCRASMKQKTAGHDQHRGKPPDR